MILSYFVGRLNVLMILLGMFGFSTLYSLPLSGDVNFTINGLLMTLYLSFFSYICKEDDFLMFVMVIGVVLFNCLVFNTDISRINWSFSIVQIFILANMNTLKRYNRRIMLVGSVIYSISLYVSFLIANQGGVVPYEFIS